MTSTFFVLVSDFATEMAFISFFHNRLHFEKVTSLQI